MLKKVVFEKKDYKEQCFFALDVNSLLPYRKQMEESNVPNAQLAVYNIFDAEQRRCCYSGCIEPTGTMLKYRDFYGSIGKSCECRLVNQLSNQAAHEVGKKHEAEGIKAAASLLFSDELFVWSKENEEES